LLWLFCRWGLTNSLPGLASNLDPPDLSLPSSWDDIRDPPAPGLSFLFCFSLVPEFELRASHLLAHALPLEPRHQPPFPFFFKSKFYI
jgi:hypothetical protein